MRRLLSILKALRVFVFHESFSQTWEWNGNILGDLTENHMFLVRKKTETNGPVYYNNMILLSHLHVFVVLEVKVNIAFF